MSIAFFFSAMSPYSWLAAERVGELIPAAEWRPVFGARVQQAHGRISWGLTERREAEMAECEARARRYGLGQMRWPYPWPSNGALVARILVHLQSQGELKRFALRAMRMEFLEGLDLGEVESLRAVASRAGFSPDEVAAAVENPDVDAAMRACCDEAVARGVFGIPTVLVDDELFWGDDRLEEAAVQAASIASLRLIAIAIASSATMSPRKAIAHEAQALVRPALRAYRCLHAEADGGPAGKSQ